MDGSSTSQHQKRNGDDETISYNLIRSIQIKHQMYFQVFFLFIIFSYVFREEMGKWS